MGPERLLSSATSAGLLYSRYVCALETGESCWRRGTWVDGARHAPIKGTRRTIRGVHRAQEETANDFENAVQCCPGRGRGGDVLHRSDQHRQCRRGQSEVRGCEFLQGTLGV